jgi:hypothetical protein
MRTLYQPPAVSTQAKVTRPLSVLGAFALAALLTLNAGATTYTIWPSGDASIYADGFVDNGNELGFGPYGTRGAMKFPLNSVHGLVASQVLLAVNLYSLPIGSNPINVYGYGSQSGTLASSDYNAGTLLGSWSLPSLTFGQDAFYDITTFFNSINAPYLAINLRAPSGWQNDYFSSLEVNYGHPSELIITVVPEPGVPFLLLVGVIVVLVRGCGLVRGLRPL